MEGMSTGMSTSPYNICGLCGHQKRREELICPRCFQDYRKEADELLRQGRTLDFLPWLQQRVEGVIEELEKKIEGELEKKRSHLKALQKEAASETTRRLKESLGGVRIPSVDWRHMWNELHPSIWRELGGNKLFYEMKQLEKRISLLPVARALLDDIMRRKKNREVDRLLEGFLQQPNQPPTTEDPKE